MKTRCQQNRGKIPAQKRAAPYFYVRPVTFAITPCLTPPNNLRNFRVSVKTYSAIFNH